MTHVSCCAILIWHNTFGQSNYEGPMEWRNFFKNIDFSLWCQQCDLDCPNVLCHINMTRLWHMCLVKDTTQHKKTQNGIIYIFFIFWKKNFWKNFQNFFFFWNFLKLFGKNFWTIFEEKKIFFENFFVSFCVVSCRVLYKTHVLSRVISIWHNTFGQSSR